MSPVLVNLLERAGWTALQTFGGMAAATGAMNQFDWQVAAVSAGAAAVLSVMKTLSVQASVASAQTTAAPPAAAPPVAPPADNLPGIGPVQFTGQPVPVTSAPPVFADPPPRHAGPRPVTAPAARP